MNVDADWDDGTVNHVASPEWNSGKLYTEYVNVTITKEPLMEVQLSDGSKVDESRRRTVEAKMPRVEEIIARLMVQIDPTGTRNSTEKTPFRVARMYLTELCSGYYTDIEELFEAVFPNEGSEGLVVVHNIPLYSLCEHHLVPIIGKAHVGYLPDGRVLGLSKVARVVDAYARRLQLQERLTKQVADAIDKHLEPRGVMVVVEAEHHCLSIRGAQRPGTITTTSEIRGDFEEGHWQDQFFRMIGR